MVRSIGCNWTWFFWIVIISVYSYSPFVIFLFVCWGEYLPINECRHRWVLYIGRKIKISKLQLCRDFAWYSVVKQFRSVVHTQGWRRVTSVAKMNIHRYGVADCVQYTHGPYYTNSGYLPCARPVQLRNGRVPGCPEISKVAQYKDFKKSQESRPLLTTALQTATLSH